MDNGAFVEATHHEFDRRRLENAGESMDSLAANGAARRVQNPDIDDPDEGSATAADHALSLQVGSLQDGAFVEAVHHDVDRRRLQNDPIISKPDEGPSTCGGHEAMKRYVAQRWMFIWPPPPQVHRATT